MLRGERNGSLWINRGRHSQKERHKVWTSGIILVLFRSFRIDTSHYHIQKYCQWKIKVRSKTNGQINGRSPFISKYIGHDTDFTGLFNRKLCLELISKTVSVLLAVSSSLKTEVDRYGKVLTYGKTDTGYKILMRLYQGRARSNVDILVYFQQRANPNQRRLFINLVYF